ncbi:expressed unknown protein [Seminavis robusta]|uniref:Uncharacterized protein n=1 Tax=Seminavis robusta TaxID=568900 RepID=A0A9N8F1K1_9STRA|nr:expressed unknown protein [Seminavis robusta]|eukprot:Sro3152_g344500.1 n/a (426) ;mRNA; r:4738-6090
MNDDWESLDDDDSAIGGLDFGVGTYGKRLSEGTYITMFNAPKMEMHEVLIDMVLAYDNTGRTRTRSAMIIYRENEDVFLRCMNVDPSDDELKKKIRETFTRKLKKLHVMIDHGNMYPLLSTKKGLILFLEHDKQKNDLPSKRYIPIQDNLPKLLKKCKGFLIDDLAKRNNPLSESTLKDSLRALGNNMEQHGLKIQFEYILKPIMIVHPPKRGHIWQEQNGPDDDDEPPEQVELPPRARIIAEQPTFSDPFLLELQETKAAQAQVKEMMERTEKKNQERLDVLVGAYNNLVDAVKVANKDQIEMVKEYAALVNRRLALLEKATEGALLIDENGNTAESNVSREFFPAGKENSVVLGTESDDEGGKKPRAKAKPVKTTKSTAFAAAGPTSTPARKTRGSAKTPATEPVRRTTRRTKHNIDDGYHCN